MERTIKCCACGEAFATQSKDKSGKCLPCRRKYEEAWRSRRKAGGLRTGGTPGFKRREGYYQEPEVKARKAARMRQYRTKPELAHKNKARSALRRAIEAGRVVKQPCEVCGSPKSQGHHDDYGKPLDVRWLCPTHHAAVHVKPGRPIQFLFRNGQVEFCTPGPRYRLATGWSAITKDGFTQPLRRVHWQDIAKRDKHDLKYFDTEDEARRAFLAEGREVTA